MTIVEFLLARIEEDAEHARLHLDPLTTLAGGMIRVRAECEAKRRIVKEATTTQKAVGAFPGGSGRLAVQYGLEAILRLLALPYADHPDYQQEWRP